MTEANRPLAALFADRRQLVGELTELNAEQLRLCQIAGGAQIDLARRERDASAGGTSPRVAQALLAASARDDIAKRGLLDCQRRIAEIEARLDRLDRQIAAVDDQKG